MEVYDITGSSIQVGERIAYPTRRGSYLEMTTGTVKGITDDGKLKVKRETIKANIDNQLPAYSIAGHLPLVTVNPTLAVSL